MSAIPSAVNIADGSFIWQLYNRQDIAGANVKGNARSLLSFSQCKIALLRECLTKNQIGTMFGLVFSKTAHSVPIMSSHTHSNA